MMIGQIEGLERRSKLIAIVQCTYMKFLPIKILPLKVVKYYILKIEVQSFS